MKSFLIMLSSSVAVCVLAVATCWCHGVEGVVDRIEAHGIVARYDDGEAMSYAAVEIRAPGSDIAFQTGRTDRNGCFAVKTDAPGDWQAVVTDGMGHRVAVDFSVAADDANAQEAEVPVSQVAGRVSRPLSTVAGLSIIFGLCGFFYGWKARRHDPGAC